MTIGLRVSTPRHHHDLILNMCIQDEIMQRVLPTELREGAPSGFAITGHIGKLFHSTFPLISTDPSAHVNLLPDYLPYKYLIGQLILDVGILNVPWLICSVRFTLIQKNKRVRTVVNKLDSIDTQFRFFKMEVIAGESDFIVEHVNLNSHFVYCD